MVPWTTKPAEGHQVFLVSKSWNWPDQHQFDVRSQTGVCGDLGQNPSRDWPSLPSSTGRTTTEIPFIDLA